MIGDSGIESRFAPRRCAAVSGIAKPDEGAEQILRVLFAS